MKKKIILKGPFLSRSGYGEQARFALRSIRNKEEYFDIFLFNIPWGETGWICEDDEERRWIDETIKKTVHYIEEKKQQKLSPDFDLSLQITIPQEWEKMAAINIGYTAGTESTKISPQWLEKCMMMDKILVTSQHTRYAFDHTSYPVQNPQTGESFNLKNTKPIEVVSYPVRTFEPCPDFKLELKHDFNFLCNAQWSPRKNIRNTIRWWVEEFWDKEVGLVVKGNLKGNSYLDREYTEKQLQNMLSEYKDRKCSIYLLHGDLSEGEVSALNQHPKIKCFINLAHGEGFGLPVFEAAYYGLPVIAPNWGGVVDFLYKPKKNKKGKMKKRPYFTKVDVDIKPVQQEAIWEPIIVKESMWAYPRQGSYKMALRKVYTQYSQSLQMAQALQKWILKKFEPTQQYEDFVQKGFKEHLPQQFDIKTEELPKISIITSVYNGDDFIENFLEDITQQTIFEEKCELILIDANSPGSEEECIKKYMKKYPNNIKYKKLDEDPGIYAVWNMGVEMASGEYLTNANLDDRKSKNSLEIHAKNLFVNEDVDVVYADSFITNTANETFENNSSQSRRYNFEQFSKESMLRGNQPHNNPMWRRRLHEEHGFFDEKFRSAGDWEFWLRCCLKGESKFKKIEQILGLYYFNPKGISTNFENFEWKQKEELEIYNRYRAA